jgi:hypothetical protein
LDGLVDANAEAEEPSDHEAHHRSVFAVGPSVLHYSLELDDFALEFGRAIEGDQVFLELLLLKCALIRVVSETNIRRDLALFK